MKLREGRMRKKRNLEPIPRSLTSSFLFALGSVRVLGIQVKNVIS